MGRERRGGRAWRLAELKGNRAEERREEKQSGGEGENWSRARITKGDGGEGRGWVTGCATLGREKRVNLIDKHRWRSNLTTFSFSQLLNYYSLSRRLLSLSPSLPPDIESNQFLVRRICFAELPAANRWSASTNEQSFQSRLTRFKKRANERTIARTKKRSSLGGERMDPR